MVVAGSVYKNVSGAALAYRTEPDMGKKAGRSLQVGETVSGVIENGWLKTDDGLYLPMVHPTTGAPLFTAQAAAMPSWKNVSGASVAYRTEPDMEKKAGTSLPPGEVVAGVIENGWLKTAAGLYLPMVHPTTGAGVLAPASSSPGAGTPEVPPGAPPGGMWLDANYVGPVTMFVYCCCFWPIILCPIDKKLVYNSPDGKKFNPSGKEFDPCCGGE
jgi:hypothetical protein